MMRLISDCLKSSTEMMDPFQVPRSVAGFVWRCLCVLEWSVSVNYRSRGRSLQRRGEERPEARRPDLTGTMMTRLENDEWSQRYLESECCVSSPLTLVCNNRLGRVSAATFLKKKFSICLEYHFFRVCRCFSLFSGCLRLSLRRVLIYCRFVWCFTFPRTSRAAFIFHCWFFKLFIYFVLSLVWLHFLVWSLFLSQYISIYISFFFFEGGFGFGSGWRFSDGSMTRFEPISYSLAVVMAGRSLDFGSPPEWSVIACVDRVPDGAIVKTRRSKWRDSSPGW